MISRRVLALAPLGLLAACAGDGEPPPAIERLRYDHLQPLRLAVAEIEVLDEYRPPRRAPNVEHRAPTPPYEAARKMAEDRLRAVGTTGRARFIIRTASIVEVPLPRTGGLRGMFTTDQSERYDGRIAVRLEVYAADGLKRGEVDADVHRSRSVAEGTSAALREAVWNTLVSQMMDDLNVELEFQLRRALPDLLA